MNQQVLVDVERLRYPNSGLGFFCHCLKQGLEEQEDAPSVVFYGDRVESSLGVRAFKSWHRLFNPTPSSFGLLHVTHQQQRYLLNTPRCKRLVTLHDLNFLFESLTPRRYRKVLHKVRRNLASADMIVCISRFVRQHLLDNLHLFELKPHVEIEVVYNGLIFDKSLGVRPEGWHLTQPYLLSIGVLQRKKQQHLLIEMLAFLPREFHLVLVYSDSKSDYLDYLRHLIDTLGLANRVHLLAQIAPQEKQFLLRNCHAYLHPSMAEGFGIPPVEAMALGRPVFLSRYTSLPEIGGEEAYYFDELTPRTMARALMNGLKDFASDPDKSRRLRFWAHRYDYRTMARTYAALYEQLLKRRD